MLLGDPLVEVLALKLGKLASEQSGIALNIPPMAQNFGGPEVNHRRHLTEMATIVLRMGSGEFAASADSTAQLRVKRKRGQSGIVRAPLQRKTPLRAGLEVDGETLEVSCLTFQPNTQR
jgi:hypothetical protein